MRKLVIIPTYNEKENVRNIINAVFALEQDFHVLIVDDSSPDGTANIVEEMRKEFPTHLHLLIRKLKMV
jgi:dolichol-phosphate mannosyltransferase